MSKVALNTADQHIKAFRLKYGMGIYHPVDSDKFEKASPELQKRFLRLYEHRLYVLEKLSYTDTLKYIPGASMSAASLIVHCIHTEMETELFWFTKIARNKSGAC